VTIIKDELTLLFTRDTLTPL